MSDKLIVGWCITGLCLGSAYYLAGKSSKRRMGLWSLDGAILRIRNYLVGKPEAERSAVLPRTVQKTTYPVLVSAFFCLSLHHAARCRTPPAHSAAKSDIGRASILSSLE